MKSKQHCEELIVMSGIAILFVLGIHGGASVLKTFCFTTMDYADANFWIRTMSYLAAPAVPMFLFVSGYKYGLNDLQTKYFSFLRKRLPRVMMSFFVINTIFWLVDSWIYIDSFDVFLMAKTYISSCLGYSVAYQLWYIPMYCFVMMLCPLMCRLIPSVAVRFCIFAVIGIAQRAMEVEIPILERYPFRFISYPVFFEMGVLAQQYRWKEHLPKLYCGIAMCLYMLFLLMLSYIGSKSGLSGFTTYVVLYFAGTLVTFMASIFWVSNRYLQWLGDISYPVFLLHEPLIGRLITAILGRIGAMGQISHAVVWILAAFLITVLVMNILKKIHADRILWGFRV